MAANPARYGAPNPSDPVIHELPPMKYAGGEVAVRLEVRWVDDGSLTGRLLFGPPDAAESLATAEIFCAANEKDFWQAVTDLSDHHLRDLYRSVAE